MGTATAGAARAVLFAQMVDDPSSRPELFPTEEAQSQERQRLFRIIEELVKWESTTNEAVLEAAREEIRKSWRRTCEDNSDFLDGMTHAMQRLADQAHPHSRSLSTTPSAVRDKGSRITSTGWETFLNAVIKAGFGLTGTWPMRTEGAGRIVAKGTNALASSIVLVCRPRPADAPIATRREFVDALKSELPGALRQMQQGNIAPVDLAQAAIGPGMAVFTRYARVLDAAGKTVSVRDAVALINQTLRRSAR